MNKEQKIPILKPSDMTGFHSQSIDWQPVINNTKHQFFHINRLETVIHNLDFPLPPHRKTVHDLIYLTKGTSKRSKGLNSFEFESAQIFLLPAFQITEHEAISKDAEGIFLHFDEQIFDFLPKNYLHHTYSFFGLEASPLISISAETQQNIEPIFKRLLALYKDETDINLVANYLLTLFQEIKNDVKTEIKKSKNSLLFITDQYKNALAQYIYQKQTVSEYADLLNISPNHLNRCTKATLHKTAQELLNEMLILEAKSLLKYSNLQIAEIADKLCDRSPSNFARFFKKQTGMTPKEYV
jgi:AraC family transcriptional regulator, transcriptional activator of pobA